MNKGAKNRSRPLVILVNATLPEEQAARIRALSRRIELIHSISKEGLRRANAIYTTQVAFDPAEAPLLRWVQLNTVAVDHILRNPITKTKIALANVRGAYSVAVAELAMGILLALERRLHICYRLQLARRWPDDHLVLKGQNCHRKTIGLIGYGSIGRHIARLADAFGMKVLACKRRPEVRNDTGFCLPNTGDLQGTIPEQWFSVEQIKEMLSRSDVAVSTLPLTDSTRRLIGAPELEALPRHAYFINVGRGGTVDSGALIECLQNRRLAGAGLDVFASEPLEPDSPLWELPNTIVTPHIGSYTEQQPYLASEVLIENILRDLTGRPLLNVVNMNAGY